jgi:cytidylate kinase
MAIITISRGSFSYGKEIAEMVAREIGYECVSREILLEASHFFNVSEKKLLESIHDAPSILDRITHGREKYIEYIRAALLEHVKRDNVVYHGHAGHLLIPEITHVLKVRVMADMDERIAQMQKAQKMSKNQAKAFIENEDDHRARWSRFLYKVDVEDPRLYDLIIHINGLKVKDACNIICNAARSDSFRTTPESAKEINDLAISSHIKAALQKKFDAEVTSDNGIVHVTVASQKIRRTGHVSPRLQSHIQETMKDDICKDVNKIVKKISGVKSVVCDVGEPHYS